MAIIRYMCTRCGLVTRVEDGQPWVACVCKAPYDHANEDEERAAAEAVPDAG